MQTPGENFLAFSVTRLELAQKEIAACVSQLSEEQLWHRAGDFENSIANLLLHLEGNMRQWILHGIADQPDVRTRDDEFALTPTVTGAKAHACFNATLAEACATILSVPESRLLAVIDPQPNGTWRHTTILEAIYRVVAHVDHHAGQIILLTKQRLARDLDLSMPRKR